LDCWRQSSGGLKKTLTASAWFLACPTASDGVILLKIPFNRPTIAGDELNHIREAIALGQLAGDGAFTERCQQWLVSEVGCPVALLTHSCTAALELAALLIDIEPGDEVIMPSFTFVSTANAVVLRRGIPVFVDIRPDTLNIDETRIEAAITSRTRAIFPVHYAGIPAEMDAINAIATRHQLAVVEDAAQALGSTYKGRPAGSLGQLAAFSFHETKNLISGEGGALAINNEAFIERAEIIREKGTNRKRFFRGQVDKYSWVDCGSSFLPGELIASFLYGQLEKSATINGDRMTNWLAYDEALRPFHNRGLQTPTVPDQCSHNAHLYYILLPSLEHRTELIARMKADDISTPFHYVPLHSAPAGLKFARTSGPMTHTNELSARLVRLPLFPKMTDDIRHVIERVQLHLNALL
jgi:dTDP-4-amino-4,6-dideoxygalactose transaminase